MIRISFVAAGSDVDIAVAQAGYAVRIQDLATLMFLDSDGEFKAYQALDDGLFIADEDPDVPSLWGALAFAPDWTGNIRVIVYRDVLNPVTMPEMTQEIRVVQGSNYATGDSKVRLDHNYAAFLDMATVDHSGAPLSDVEIRVLDTSSPDRVLGITFTNHLGQWAAPVYVEPGPVTVVFSKEGRVSQQVQMSIPTLMV